MASYECWLTVIGSKPLLWRFDKVYRREMDYAEAQHRIPLKNTVELPQYFRRYSDKPQIKGYTFCTNSLPVAYVRRLSRRFPSLVFNLTFDISRDIWDKEFEKDGFEQTGDFTLKNGVTACGYFTFEPVNRYPAWDYDTEEAPEQNQKYREVS